MFCETSWVDNLHKVFLTLEVIFGGYQNQMKSLFLIWDMARAF